MTGMKRSAMDQSAMDRSTVSGLWMLIVLLSCVVAVAAQDGSPRKEGGSGQKRGERRGAARGAQVDRMAMRSGGRVVTGSPYSAEVVTESVQTLTDGTKLTRQNSGMVYRDSQGRSRREQGPAHLGPFGEGGEAPRAVFISDPVSGVAYTLFPDRRVGRRQPMSPEQEVIDAGQRPAGKGEQGRQGGGRNGVKNGGRNGDRKAGRPGQRGRGPGAAGSSEAGLADGKVADGNFEVRVESLGKRDIDGLTADGERRTTVIPVNRIGNDRPIEIVEERWKSPELKTTIYSRTLDPRWGEHTFRLTKINRSEPDSSLFAPTADYSIEERAAAKESRTDAPRRTMKRQGRR